jgi:phospholipid transport system substrate-binding protein
MCRKPAFRKIIGAAALIAGSVFGSTTQAAETPKAPKTISTAANFVLDTGQQAISILSSGEKDEFKLKRLFRSRFDYELMGRYALGRYWEKADTDQQIEYSDLFAEYVPNGYMGQLKEYRGAKIALVKSLSITEFDSLVTTKLAPITGDAMIFDWRVRAQERQFKVIDLVVGGVSYLKLLRQQFTAIAGRNGIEGLLKLLRKHAAANAAQAGNKFRDLAARIGATEAINVSEKISLKSKVDALVQDLGRHHDGEGQFDIESLKQRFDSLFRNTVAMLEGRDPSLAAEIASMHPSLWRALKDPKHFVVVAMQ